MPARKKNKQKPVNLLPKEDFDRTMLGRVLKWALTSFRYIVIFVELVVILGFLSRFWLDVRISDLDEEIKQKTALISSRSSFEQEFRRTKKQLEIYSQITNPANNISPILQLAVNNLPDDAQIITFKVEDNNLEISGSSITESSIGGYLANLTAEERLNNVILRRIESPSDSPFIEFTIEALVADSQGG